jgi:predicted dehydrogenase
MKSPGSPLVAVVGCGYWDRNLIRSSQALGHLAAACDVAAEGRGLAQSLAPGVRILTDAQEVWTDTAMSGVVIATPAATHARLCQQALESGKDAKLLSLRLEDAQRLSDTVSSHGHILMVGHVLEHHPAIDRVREFVNTGQVGRLRSVYSNRINLGKVRREKNILYVAPRSATRGSLPGRRAWQCRLPEHKGSAENRPRACSRFACASFPG